MNQLTADSITDEQICELQRVARAAPFDGHDLTTIYCAIALHERLAPAANVAKCRARCAEIINARAATGSK